MFVGWGKNCSAYFVVAVDFWLKDQGGCAICMDAAAEAHEIYGVEAYAAINLFSLFILSSRRVQCTTKRGMNCACSCLVLSLFAIRTAKFCLLLNNLAVLNVLHKEVFIYFFQNFELLQHYNH